MKAFEFRPKILDTLRNYDKKNLTSDVMAGIIVGIVALPLAIAFGIASGVTPEKGIITAIVAGLIISVFGGSKVQIGGPTGAFIIIIYGIIQQYGIEGLAIATFMAGAFLVLFGLQLASVPSDFIEKWVVYIQNLTTADLWTTIIGLLSVVVIAITPRFSKKIPGSLIAIIVMTVIALLLKNFAGVSSIETIGDRFSISAQLPDAHVPQMT